MSLENEIAECLQSLRPYALFLTKSESAADDLLQEAAERALRYRAQFQPGTNLTAWARAIVYRRFCRLYSNARRYSEVVAAAPYQGAHDPRSAAEARDELRTAMRRVVIRPEYAEMVERCDVLGQSEAEAAAAADVPVGTVKSRLRRGRAALRAALLGAGIDAARG